MKYWASVGDHQREELIGEKIARIEKAQEPVEPRIVDSGPHNMVLKPDLSKRHARLDKSEEKKRKRKLKQKQKRKGRK